MSPAASIPRRALSLVLLAPFAILACQSEAAPPPDPLAGLPALADLSGDGWHTIAAGGETACSDGSAYTFFVRKGDPSKLLVYLQGGGACWDGATCDAQGRPSYRPTVGDTDPNAMHGIFALGLEENPFAEHTMVFVPYCTGDVHLGDAVASYEAPATEESPARALDIRHQGHANVERVLEWTYRHIDAPEEVFVTGSSAGAIPSPHYTMHLAERYPEARIRQLGDGAGGYRRGSGGSAPHERWGTLPLLATEHDVFADLAPDAFNYETLYIEAARRHPEILFAEYDTAEDATQLRFLSLSGNSSDSLLPLLDANQSDIRSKVKNFRAYIAGGDLHTVLARPEFYAFHVGGRRVRDWVAALAAGEEVEDVRCVLCGVAEVLEGGAMTTAE